MKRVILLGSLISIVILLLTPQLSAVQYSLVTNTQEQHIKEQLSQALFSSTSLTESQKNTLVNKVITPLFTIINSEQFSTLKNKLQSNNDDDETGPPQPLFFPFLGIFVYGLIAYILLKIIGIILQNVGFIISGIISAIVSRIVGVITIILTIITAIINGIISLITGVATLIVKVAAILLNIIVLIISAILSLIIAILTGLFRLLERVWIGFGNFLGFILDVLKLIYESIFSVSSTA
jgi:hypothetical protein